MPYNLQKIAEENAKWAKKQFSAIVDPCRDELTLFLSNKLPSSSMAEVGSILSEMSHAYGVQSMATLPLGDVAGLRSFQLSLAYRWLSIKSFMAHLTLTGKAPNAKRYSFINGCALALSALKLFSSEAYFALCISQFTEAVNRGIIDKEKSTPLFIFVCWILNEQSPIVTKAHFNSKKDYPSDLYFRIMEECHAGTINYDFVSRLLDEHIRNTDDHGDSGFQEFLFSPWRECPVEVLCFCRRHNLKIIPDSDGLMSSVWNGIRFNDLYSGDALAIDIEHKLNAILPDYK